MVFEFLDFGCGSGAISIAAALSSAASVVACDLSREALRFVEVNAERMGCSQVEIGLVGARTSPILDGRAFDVILCNPASLPAFTPGDAFWSGGRYGTDMIFRMIGLAEQHLERSGYLLFVHTSLASLHRSLQKLASANMSAAIIASTRVRFRKHYDQLLPYFSELREQGEIFYETVNGTTFETLYLIHARHFDKDAI